MGRHVEKEKKDIQRYFLLSHYTISANPIYLFIYFGMMISTFFKQD